MSILRRDYILRLIEQFAEALGRILGLRKAGNLDEARDLLRSTADGIFGPLMMMLERVDAGGAAALLGSAEKISIYAALTAEEAEIAQDSGDLRKALAGRRRALELYLEASRLGSLDARARDSVESLRQTVDENRLEGRYRDLIARLPPLIT